MAGFIAAIRMLDFKSKIVILGGFIAVMRMRSHINDAKLYFEAKKLERNRLARKAVEYKESRIDTNNPPAEVCEAAADMGLSVEEYKEKYLNHPSICEIMTEFHDGCVKFHNGNDSECSSYLKMKESTYKCSTFEEKYSGQRLKYAD